MLCLTPRGLFHLSFAVVLLALAGAAPLFAQATTVTLEVKVTGKDGSVPQGAQIEVRSRETAASRSGLVRNDGTYRALGLAPGVYDLVVRAIGYRQQRLEGVQLIIGQRAAVNFALEPGTVELEPIVVTAERAFEVDRTDVSTAVLQEEIEKLPLNSRNVLNIAAVAPGIRSFAAEGGRTAPAAGSLPVTQIPIPSRRTSVDR